MEQLVQMKSVPISFQYGESKHPHTISQSVANLQITRDSLNLDIKSNPVKFKMDVFSKGNNEIARNQSISYTATAGLDSSGNMRVNLSFGGDTNALRLAQVGRDMVGIAARSGQSVSLASDSLALSFDLKGITGLGTNTKFTPPDLEFGADDNSRVYLTYVGEPLYFPLSADPNYEPPVEMQESAPTFNYFPISADPNYEPPAVDLVGPQYFPKSADPNYEPPATGSTGPRYFPESSDPNYEPPVTETTKAVNAYTKSEVAPGFKANA